MDLSVLAEDGFKPVKLDICDRDSVENAVSQALEITGGEIGGVVNNAGFGQPGAVEDLSRDALRQQFEVNLFGLLVNLWYILIGNLENPTIGERVKIGLF